MNFCQHCTTELVKLANKLNGFSLLILLLLFSCTMVLWLNVPLLILLRNMLKQTDCTLCRFIDKSLILCYLVALYLLRYTYCLLMNDILPLKSTTHNRLAACWPPVTVFIIFILYAKFYYWSIETLTYYYCYCVCDVCFQFI